MSKRKQAYLLTGANLGDRIATLERANQLIETQIGPISKASSYYQTAAWGNVDQPDYLNQALEVSTELLPKELLKTIHEIEATLGRIRRTKWESRPIDIDILFFEDKTLNTSKLTIPHAQLHRRNFVLIPMLEIAPELIHPVLVKTIEELYWDCEDPLDVVKLEDSDLSNFENLTNLTEPETVKP